jgi:hypothetical protein
MLYLKYFVRLLLGGGAEVKRGSKSMSGDGNFGG